MKIKIGWMLAIAMLGAHCSANAQHRMYMQFSTGQFAEAAASAEARLKESPQETRATIPLMCATYSQLKDYGKLADCIVRLEDLIRSGITSHDDRMMFPTSIVPMPETLRATMALDHGDPAGALKWARAALEKVGKRPGSDAGMFTPSYYRVELLPVLGIASAMLRDDAGAAKAADDLVNLDIPFIGGGLYRNQRTSALARVYFAMRQYDKALEQLSKGESLSAARAFVDLVAVSKGESTRNYFALSQQLMVAKCYAETGNVAEATKVLDALIQHPRIADQGDVQWIALWERGLLAEKAGDAAHAVDLYRRSVEVIERQRATINAEASKIGFVGDKQAVYGRLISLLVAQNAASEAFAYVERSKARALVDLLASKRDFAGGRDPERTRAVLAELDAADAAVRAAAPAGEAATTATRTLETKRAEIRQVAPELSSLVTVTSVPSEELRSLIRGDERLVEYYYQGADLLAFVLTREALSVQRLSAEGLGEEVQGFRAAMLEPGSNKWQEPATALYRRVWAPLEPLLEKRDVIVVAHGALHYLPFAALRRTDGQLLVDRQALRFLPSASVLKFLKPSLKSAEGLLLLGNPDLNDPALDLKFAEEEARSLAKMNPRSRLLVRKEASETNFKKTGGVFSRIHFATHGKFNADTPLASGLYLAGDADNDGVLTVGELYSMNLDADLVTLSACETGLGKVANGDDVVGLTRGFLYAGGRSIVASLWSVDDRATATLMNGFYERLPKLSKQQALREAQLRTRQEFPHPFFWAAFQLTGRAD